MTETYPSIGYLTDPGRERTENQDNLVVRSLPWGTLLLVADGMGGHKDGSLASAIAAETITGLLSQAHPDPSQPAAIQGLLWEALVQANAAIWSRASQEQGVSNMGTTAVLAVVIKGRVYVAHVGDSRLYHVRQGLPAQITRDHTTVQAMVDHGIISMAQSKVHPDANKLAKALGVRESVEPEVRAEPVLLESGDVLVLCSDGLYDVVTDDSIAELASRLPSEAAARKLVQTANEAGGPDNISVIVYQHGKPRIRKSLTRGMPAQRPRRGLPLWAWISLGVIVAAAAVLALWRPWDGEEEPEEPVPVQETATEKTPVIPPQPSLRPVGEPAQPVQGSGGRETNGPASSLRPEGQEAPGAGPAQHGAPEGPRGTMLLDGGRRPEDPLIEGANRNGSEKIGQERAGTRTKGKCEAGNESEADKLVPFKNLIENIDDYLRRNDGERAASSYELAEQRLRDLPFKLQQPCRSLLAERRYSLHRYYLQLTRYWVEKRECSNAKKRSLDARKFGAPMDAVKEALGDCWSPGGRQEGGTESGTRNPLTHRKIDFGGVGAARPGDADPALPEKNTKGSGFFGAVSDRTLTQDPKKVEDPKDQKSVNPDAREEIPTPETLPTAPDGEHPGGETPTPNPGGKPVSAQDGGNPDASGEQPKPGAGTPSNETSTATPL